MNSISLKISISRQRLDLIATNGSVLQSFCVSTSRFGVGSEVGSFRTPVGAFCISEKIGASAELGLIFKSRVPTGRIGDEEEPDDFVQTRILRLSGLDPENANTHSRYVYVHGTNHESQLGLPASFGCVRMGNAAIADLFDWVDENMPVEIR